MTGGMRPVENATGDNGFGYYAEGLTDALIAEDLKARKHAQ